MTITENVKTSLIDIIEWTEDSTGAMLWKMPLENQEIAYGAKLSVRDFQIAMFLHEGLPADIFKPGIYTLTKENLPLLSIRNRWKPDFKNNFQADVYFYKTKIFIDQPWAFEKPVMMQHKTDGLAWSQASGTFDVRIINPIKLIQKAQDVFTTQQVRDMVNSMIISLLGEAVMNNPEDEEGNEEVSTFILQSINTELHGYGLEVINLTVRTHELQAEAESKSI